MDDVSLVTASVEDGLHQLRHIRDRLFLMGLALNVPKTVFLTPDPDPPAVEFDGHTIQPRSEALHLGHPVVLPWEESRAVTSAAAILHPVLTRFFQQPLPLHLRA